jgi:DNA-binding beta-propeller fold protein YncE
VSPGFAYIGASSTEVDVCAIGPSGSLSTSCPNTGGVFSSPAGIALAGGYAYVANSTSGMVSVCSISGDGTLLCGTTVPVGSEPMDIAINGSHAYVDDLLSGDISLCSVGPAGGLMGCTVPVGSTTFSAPSQIAIH